LTLRDLVFAILAAITVFSGWLVVTERSLFRAGLFLALCFASVAGLYVLLAAEFLFVIQILVYVGAIAILILFVVMFTRHLGGVRIERQTQSWPQTIIAAVAVVAFGLIAWFVLTGADWGTPRATPPGIQTGGCGGSFAGNTALIGKSLLTAYVLPFEIASLVLVVALVGAVYLAKPDRGC
jgi:NADH:ubiquinone oxidoreductase subunit 6 (subunit J)